MKLTLKRKGFTKTIHTYASEDVTKHIRMTKFMFTNEDSPMTSIVNREIPKIGIGQENHSTSDHDIAINILDYEYLYLNISTPLLNNYENLLCSSSKSFQFSLCILISSLKSFSAVKSNTEGANGLNSNFF